MKYLDPSISHMFDGKLHHPNFPEDHAKKKSTLSPSFFFPPSKGHFESITSLPKLKAESDEINRNWN